MRQTDQKNVSEALRTLADMVEKDPENLEIKVEAKKYRPVTKEAVEEREKAARNGYVITIGEPVTMTINFDGRSL
jgi:hypothetical protein